MVTPILNENCHVHDCVGVVKLETKVDNPSSAKFQKRESHSHNKDKKTLENIIKSRYTEVTGLNGSNIKIDFGNGNILSGETEISLDNLAETHLKQHYPDYYLTSNNVIFVPEVFITSTSDIVDENEAKGKLHTLGEKAQKSKRGKIDNYRGGEIEKSVYYFLKAYFEDYNGKAIIFHGYHLASRPDVSSVSSAEKDFIILLDTGFIINIECKPSTSSANVRKACSQLKSFHLLFEDWYGDNNGLFVLEKEWQVISIAYCEQQPNKVIENVCDYCKQFICTKKLELQHILEKIVTKIDCNKIEFAADLKSIFYHMLFTTSLHVTLVPRNVGQVIVHQVQQKQGTVEVIQYFSFWTSSQLNLVHNDFKKVLFNSYWGTGKTKLLLHKAEKIARVSYPMDVLLFICHDDEMETLFSLKIKNTKKFQRISNLQVICIPHKNSFERIKEEVKNRDGNCHVFVDELYVSIKSFDYHKYWQGMFQEEAFIESIRGISTLVRNNYCWIAFGGVSDGWFDRWKIERNFAELPGLRDFYIPRLDKPLRCTRCIIEYVKDNHNPNDKVYTHYPCIMASTMKYVLPPNLIQGTTEKLKVIFNENVEDSLHVAKNKFHKDDRILFIATRRKDIGYFSIFINNVFKDIPLVWGSDERHHQNSDKIDIQNWLDGQGPKYLLASANVCRGFEYPYIIHLCDMSATKGWNANAMTRCTAHLEIINVPYFTRQQFHFERNNIMLKF